MQGKLFKLLFVIASLSMGCATTDRRVGVCTVVGEPDYPTPTLECTSPLGEEFLVTLYEAARDRYICNTPSDYKKVLQCR